jgi:hypothetical protein
MKIIIKGKQSSICSQRKSKSYDRLAFFSANEAQPPTPKFNKSKPFNHLTDLEPLEVARQLTLIEFKLFTMVKPQELLKQQFSKKKQGESNVKAMSSMSTLVCENSSCHPGPFVQPLCRSQVG